MTDVMTETIVEQAMATLEIIELENLLNEECKCENLHTSPDNQICSHSVTHLFTCPCGKQAKFCRNAATRVITAKAVRPNNHATHQGVRCGARLADWKVVAI